MILMLLPCESIRVMPDVIAACQLMDKRTRIYIRGHCIKGSEILATDGKKNISAPYLAELFAHYVLPSSDIFVRSDTKFKISLSGCQAGLSDLDKPIALGCINNSFAARFLKALQDKNIDCAIAARLGVVSISSVSGEIPRMRVVSSAEHVNYMALSVRKHASQQAFLAASDKSIKQEIQDEMLRLNEQRKAYYYSPRDNRAKVIYQYIGKQQTITSAYASKQGEVQQWRAAVLDTINECIVSTRLLEKKLGLARLLNDIFFGKSNEEIYALIEHELTTGTPGSGYEVNTHSCFVSRIRGSLTSTHKRLQDLLADYRSNPRL